MPKRNPITDICGHLSWTSSGVVWATYAITPLSYGRRALKDKRVVREMHKLLFRGLDGEALLLGLAVALDPVTVVERQIAGVMLERCPGLAAEAEANLDRLEELVLGERAFFLAVPLSNRGRHRWSAQLSAAFGMLKEQVGAPGGHPSEAEVAARTGQAAAVQRLIPGPFKARPVTAAEQVWISAEAVRRGLSNMAPPEPGSIDEDLTLRSGIGLPQPILDEGAWSDLDTPAAGAVDLVKVEQSVSVAAASTTTRTVAAGLGSLAAAQAKGLGRSSSMRNPLTRRVLKVLDPYGMDLGQPASYQVPMVLTDTPNGGLVWPGSELLSTLDNLAADVDWAIRLRVNAREKVMAANKKALVSLTDQFDQRSDETTLGSSDLDLAAAMLADYQTIYAADRLEVEVEHAVILTVADASAAAAMERATALITSMANAEFRLERPVGALTDLWWATQVGIPTSRVVRGWSMFTSAGRLSALVPFISTQLGGKRGPVWGLNTSSARTGVVHLDPGGYPELDLSGSVASTGALGAGKTFLMESMCDAILSMGGQVMTIDKSNEGEWAKFGATFEDVVIVDDADPAWSMDPLRCLGLVEGGNVCLSFLSQLLNLSPQEEDGITLGQVLDHRYLAAHHLEGLQDVMEHLERGCELPYAEQLGRRLRNYANNTLGRVVFDQSLPPVVGTAGFIVWRTRLMGQPTTEEISTPHLFRALPPAKVFGRAYYALLTGTARRWAFADVSRVSALVCDEAYDIFSNPENARDLETFVRQGRRPKALLLVGSHDPDRDFGSETLRSLIPTRVAMRQPDERLARASIAWLGIDPTEPDFDDMVDQLRFHTSPPTPDKGVPIERRGECFLRDAFGGVGSAKVLGPAQAHRGAAVLSTPPKSGSSV